MAADAFPGCSFERLVDVTRCTRGRKVHAFQDPYLSMIELFHTAAAIVTIEAGGTNLADMFIDKRGLSLAMTVAALNRGEQELLTSVAGKALKGCSVVIDDVLR